MRVGAGVQVGGGLRLRAAFHPFLRSARDVQADIGPIVHPAGHQGHQLIVFIYTPHPLAQAGSQHFRPSLQALGVVASLNVRGDIL